jgi:hypothetical protein
MKSKTAQRQYIKEFADLLNSPALMVLSHSAMRALNRIKIELCRHGGKDNGRLPVTHEDFRRYGIHDHAISPALRELDALGIAKPTQFGTAGNAGDRRPNLFLLTFLPADGKPASDEWRQIQTVGEAEAIAMMARANKRNGYRSARFPVAENRQWPQWR